MKKLDSLLDKIEGTLCTLFACVMAVSYTHLTLTTIILV